jgi:hypothetical protein
MAPRIGRVLRWSEWGAIVVIVLGFGLELVTGAGELVVKTGVGVLVATPFGATLVAAAVARGSHRRMTVFALATIAVAALGILAALSTAGR